MEAFETFEHKGYTINLHYEQDTEHADPRDNDNLGVMACRHPNYNLGDDGAETELPDEPMIECSTCEGSGESRERYYLYQGRAYGHVVVGAGTQAAVDGLFRSMDSERQARHYIEPANCPTCDGEGECTVTWYEYIVSTHGATVVLPLFLLDHSGLSIHAGQSIGSIDPRSRFAGDDADWDTSMVGFIFDTSETRRMTGCEGPDFGPDKIEEGLRAEVDEYDSYLRGEVYYYTVEGADGEMVGSCGGFLGDDGLRRAREEARSEAEGARRDADRERDEIAYWAARDVMTVGA